MLLTETWTRCHMHTIPFNDLNDGYKWKMTRQRKVDSYGSRCLNRTKI